MRQVGGEDSAFDSWSEETVCSSTTSAKRVIFVKGFCVSEFGERIAGLGPRVYHPSLCTPGSSGTIWNTHLVLKILYNTLDRQSYTGDTRVVVMGW